MKKFIKLIKNNLKIEQFNLKLFFLLILFFTLFLNLVKSENVRFREGTIKYISKPTIISKPFILLSTNERFYITNELYQNLIQNSNNNYNNEQNKINITKYYYFKIVDNIVYEINKEPFKNYVYEFPKIFKTKIFEFNNYDIIYILFYYNLSEFVNIKAKDQNNQNLFIYYTSLNSISIKLPKNQKLNQKLNQKFEYIKLYLNYENPYFKNLKFKNEYIIKL